MTRTLRIPAHAWRVLSPIAEQAVHMGLEVHIVGGCVRDWLLKRDEKGDFDLVCEKDPEPLAQFCAKAMKGRLEAFGQFGTLRMLGEEHRVDFARARTEEYPEPAVLPVVSPSTLRADLFRRDFTINAMALPLTPEGKGEVLDLHGGLKDIEKGVVRPIHEASFRDDPTRVFRGARFLCRFGFAPAEGFITLAGEALRRGHAAKLSRHRLLQELWSILEEEEPAYALETLKDWGYLDLIDPRLAWNGKGRTAEERLAHMALAMKEDAAELLKSLPIEHAVASRIAEALELFAARQAPRGPISATARAVVRQALPDLPKAALEPVLVTGEDLKAAGMPPSPAYRELLDAAAAAQWKGEFASRAGALKWLKGRLA